jgi:hypothetical protein
MSKRPERVNTVQLVRRFYRSWWRRPFWLLGLALVGVIAGRIALTPLMMKWVRGELDRRAGAGVVTFRDLDLYLLPPTFVFKEVTVRPSGGGESLELARAEVHVASWRELREPLPMVRVRFDRPVLRMMPGEKGLETIARALPAARIEVATIAGGTIGNGAATAGRPVMERIAGEVEGLATGSEVGRAKWQFWGDVSLLGVDPVHVVVGGEPNGSWQATVAGRQADASGTAPPPALSFDGHASGNASRARGLVHLSWTTAAPPVALAGERSRSLDERWPPTNLRLLEVRRVSADAPADPEAADRKEGGSTDAVVDGEGVVTSETNRIGLAVGLVVGMVRLGNRAIAAPPPGLAALGEQSSGHDGADEQPPGQGPGMDGMDLP